MLLYELLVAAELVLWTVTLPAFHPRTHTACCADRAPGLKTNGVNACGVRRENPAAESFRESVKVGQTITQHDSVHGNVGCVSTEYSKGLKPLGPVCNVDERQTEGQTVGWGVCGSLRAVNTRRGRGGGGGGGGVCVRGLRVKNVRWPFRRNGNVIIKPSIVAQFRKVCGRQTDRQTDKPCRSADYMFSFHVGLSLSCAVFY